MIDNPYWGTTFFEFFYTLFCRIFAFCSGKKLVLASDELQLAVLVLVAVTSGLVGTFFVLRKMTMLANALSHTILPGVVLSYLAYHYFGPPQGALDFSHLLPNDAYLIGGALVSAFITTWLTRLVVAYLPVKEDASIGMVFTLLFAVGILLVTTLTKSAHIGAELIMGNVDALHFDDLQLMFWIFVATTSTLLLLWRPLFLTSFDPLFAKMCGISNDAVSYLLMGLVSVAAIGAFRAVGVLLFLSFLVTPALIGRALTNKMAIMALLSCVAGAVASLVAVALSRHILSVYDVSCSTAGLVVTLLALSYGLIKSRSLFRPV